MPWARKKRQPQPLPTLPVRGCKMLRAHNKHLYDVGGRRFSCPGIEPRGILPRHPNDNFLFEAEPKRIAEGE